MKNNRTFILLNSLLFIAIMCNCTIGGINQRSKSFYDYMSGNFNVIPDNEHIYIIVSSNSCSQCVNKFVESLNNSPAGFFPQVVLITTSTSVKNNLKNDLGIQLLLDNQRKIDEENLNLFNISCIIWGRHGIKSIHQLSDVNDLLKISKSSRENQNDAK